MGDGPSHERGAGAQSPRRLFVYNGGFLTQGRVRRILELSGWDIRLGLPGEDDWVGVWGRSPTSGRGDAVAERRDSPILRVEDAFLRSVLPARAGGSAAVGLCLDEHGVHFDSTQPSDLEHLLRTAPLDDTALLDRARDCMAWQREAHLSKYNAFDPGAPLPQAPYVLVIDQTRGDASIEWGGGSAEMFREMLVFAQTEHPGSEVIIKTHPETASGARQGHFGPEDESPRVRLLRDPVSPWALMEGAIAVYTVSSVMGFEAIMAGHRPRVFGQPFYAGWGLTQDENPVPRRSRSLTRAQLYAAAMILYPTWYDPYHDRLSTLEEAMATLQSQARAWREDHRGYVAHGMRLWKRAPLRQFFGPELRFAKDEQAARAKAGDRPVMGWGAKAGTADLRVEDGFMRSRGLGADLIPALSLVSDDLGLYYDPTQPSRLEECILERADLAPYARNRAEDLIRQIVGASVSKYNLGGDAPALPEGRRILVAGQVEDDASVTLGCSDIRTNDALLRAARQANPDAVLIYKPHPDVEAGLRKGAVETKGLADIVARKADPLALIAEVDAVWVMTSLLGFEALMRGKPVTCAGMPFYAGWGLTHDLLDAPERRNRQVSLASLVHAALIDYPRYRDPVTGLACPVEVAVQRLAEGRSVRRGPGLRILAKAQGLMASYAHLWR